MLGSFTGATPLHEAMKIHTQTTPDAVTAERVQASASTVPIQKNDNALLNSDFLYPTIIIIPIVIVVISIVALDISIITKIILVGFLILSLVIYVLQFKKVNIEQHLVKLSDSLKKK